ncbi:Protein phosphatase 2C 2 [Tieghemiomyces parasiticus]|uniref:protein-serine/threonine phosphatase n=1 Tax=Tieghemiomyces parasiticus TaxID=78921 RepID=A0A9W8DT01_9FUNG|nr:Protein phosphatase 2C 2 [Tieghemiomyces parasiticus]
MGQTLSEPIVEKHTDHGGDKRFNYAVSSMQGWRLSMEDAHTTLLDVKDGEGKSTGVAFFAVYDGHGGVSSANFSGQELHNHIIQSKAFAAKDYEAAIKEGFLSADAQLRDDEQFQAEFSGCTAIGALLTADNVLYVGNAGDSRAVLSSNGKTIALSYDHKPTNKTELQRIQDAGGFIEFGRVNGNLALSRAIGDFEFKQNHDLPAEKQIVTADPDVIRHEITPEDEFIVVACDGIWDVLKSSEVVHYVQKHLARGESLSQICESMMDTCLAPSLGNTGVGCDNMTVIIVALLQGQTPEEWQEGIKRRYLERHPNGLDSPDPQVGDSISPASTPGGAQASLTQLPSSVVEVSEDDVVTHPDETLQRAHDAGVEADIHAVAAAAISGPSPMADRIGSGETPMSEDSTDPRDEVEQEGKKQKVEGEGNEEHHSKEA